MARHGKAWRRWLGSCLTLGLILASTVVCAKPSIVLILADDEDAASHHVMERTRALIEEQGTVLADATPAEIQADARVVDAVIGRKGPS